MNAAFQMSDADKQSGQWSRLAEHLENRLDDLRRQNDDPQKTDVETAFIRGRISEVKRLIELGTSRQELKFPQA